MQKNISKNSFFFGKKMIRFGKLRKAPGRNMKQENIELSVKEASLLIGVTTRSILNYIKAKEITAIKVGKSWYIKEPSLMAFAKRYGLIGQEDTLNSTDTTPIEISKKIFPKDKKKYIINTLKLYEIASKAFSMPRWGRTLFSRFSFAYFTSNIISKDRVS